MDIPSRRVAATAAAARLKIRSRPAARLRYAALLAPPGTALVLLDDVLAALDGPVQKALMQNVRRLADERKCGILLATHQRHLLGLADRLVELDASGSASPASKPDVAALPPPPPRTPQTTEKKSKAAAAPGGGGGADLVKKEDQRTGRVRGSVWAAFLKAAGPCAAAGVLFLFLLAQLCLILADYAVLDWSTARRQKRPRHAYARPRRNLLL